MSFEYYRLAKSTEPPQARSDRSGHAHGLRPLWIECRSPNERGRTEVWFRRILPVPSRTVESQEAEQKAAAPARRSELVKMPHFGLCRLASPSGSVRKKTRHSMS